MKRWPVLLSLAGALVAGQAQPAQAINREWSAALGFLGGVLVADNYHHRGYERCPPMTYRECPPPQVVYTRPCPPPPPPVVVIREGPSGHYEYQERQVWVPGRWEYQEVGCNTYRKTWCPGFYRTETVRVWVDDSCGRMAYSDRLACPK